MYYFKNTLSRDELVFMREIAAQRNSKIKLLREFSGECYILLEKNYIDGVYRSYADLYGADKLFDDYRECFGVCDSFYGNERCEFLKCTPSQIIKFYYAYFVKTAEFPDEWYRGTAQSNGNILLEVYADTLEEIAGSL